MFELQEPYFNCPKVILNIYILQNMFNVYIILKSMKKNLEEDFWTS